jgi:hypothetical protein
MFESTKQDRSYYSSIELSDLSTPSIPERIALTLSNNPNSSKNPSSSAQAGGAADAETSLENGLEGRFARRERERETVESVREGWEGRVGEVRLSSSPSLSFSSFSILQQADVRTTGTVRSLYKRDEGCDEGYDEEY